MSDLKFFEKNIFERIFDRGGYVLDFSNRTFQEFFYDYNIDIYSEKYSLNGDSKMKRLRAFWDIEPNIIVGEVLEGLLNYNKLKFDVDEKLNESSIRIVKRLKGIKQNETTNESLNEGEFLEKDFEKIDLSKLNLGSLENIINQRMVEIESCYEAKSYLATILLCGSVLEGILLNVALQNKKVFNTSFSAPKDREKVKQFQNWTLNDFINVSHELGFIGLDVKKFSHAVREFRNFIHPYEHNSKNFTPDKHTSKISWQVVHAVIDHLSKRENN